MGGEWRRLQYLSAVHPQHTMVYTYSTYIKHWLEPTSSYDENDSLKKV